MNRLRRKILGLAWFLFVLTFISGMITIAYFLTAYFYELMHWQPQILLRQIINTLLGLLLGGSLIGTVSRFARARGWLPEMNVFGPIVEALEQIARGDFSVRLTDEFEENQMVSRLATSVNKMALELDQMENMRQEFISNVSHEIQSPLTSIRGFARALENDELAQAERHHYLNIIEEESMRLSRITEDLLRLAALESGQLKFEPTRYSLDRQIRSLILACEPQWREKSIQMDVSLDEVAIVADEDLLSQVWVNLIHNGIKFTPREGTIKMRLWASREQIEFTITDTGIGISEDDLPRVFERFYKADKSRTRSQAGSGLGLAIAKKIIDLHKGTVQVESRQSQGATFTVRLPTR